MAYTKDIGLQDFYKLYVENSVKRCKEYKDYKTYVKILKAANLKIRDKIIYNSDKVILPYRLGNISIYKFQNTYTELNKKNWKINFQATKQKGITVYYGAEYGYKWKWDKKECIVNGKKWYKFKPCRTASRMIADAVNNKQLDFYN